MPNLPAKLNYMGLVLATVLTNISFAASPNNLFQILTTNTPSFDLALPKLESREYRPLGLPVMNASPAIKSAITQYETKRPTPYTPKASVLKSCQLIGVQIELDNQAPTQEWLITPNNTCGGVSSFQAKTFWIVQQSANKIPTVLLAQRAYRVKVLQKWPNTPASTFRTLDVYLKGAALGRSTQKMLPVQCQWQFIKEGAGSYYSRYSVPQIEVQRGDPKRGSGWVVVTGVDEYVEIDDHYRCPEN